MKQAAVLYSGGTDSTAAVVLIAERFERIHLLTFRHSGLRKVGNSSYNLPALQKKFGAGKFVHRVFDTDRLFRALTYERYSQNVRRFGFFNLTTCGFCKLAMHVRTLLYCLDHGIDEAVDGANKNMSHFPAQMPEVLALLRGMYARAGIAYTNPVFDLDFPAEIDWFHKLGLAALARPAEAANAVTGRTTGQVLFEAGLMPEENIKGKALDRRLQPHCLQLMLLNVFALGYYIPSHGMERYRRGVADFYREKIARCDEWIDDYRRNRAAGPLGRWIEAAPIFEE